MENTNSKHLHEPKALIAEDCYIISQVMHLHSPLFWFAYDTKTKKTAKF